MKIHHRIEAPASPRPLVLALGFFDGFHLGHREIVRALMRQRRPGYRAAVLTFRNHPATHLRPEHVPPLISTVEERVNHLAAAGIDELFLVPFDDGIARVDARRFCLDILHGVLGARTVVVGENFRFGAGRSGDAALAREALATVGSDVVAVAPVADAGERVSSTRVRAAILGGDMTTANRLLGAAFELRGRIELGAGRGHDLGFPTANLRVIPEKTIPADGVYAIVARHDGRDYPGLVSIGTNPTFAGTARTVEAWLLDFKRTVYGEDLVLRDFRFVREQRTFASIQELLVQMNDDATHARFPSFVRT
ncbi:MAG: bifunctional riboflavin kinase/FAD synthetase [Vulcanimicrobiaceae bacterium]